MTGPSNHPAASVSPRPMSLRQNFSFVVIGNVMYAACQWGILVVVAKVGTTRMVGQLALALAVVMPVVYFLNLQLRGILATDAAHEFSFEEYLALRIVCAALAFTISCGIALLGPFDGATTVIIVSVALVKTFDFVSDIFYGLAQQHQRMHRIAVSLILQGVLQIASLGAIVSVTKNITWALLGSAAMSAIVTVVYDVRTAVLAQGTGATSRGVAENVRILARGIQRNLRSSALARLAWIGLPMGVVLGLNSVVNSIPRYTIAHSLGEDQLGIFAGMFYFIVAGQQVVAAMGDSSAPRLALSFASHEYSQFLSLLARLVACGLSLGLLGVLFAFTVGPRVLTLVYNEDFAGHSDTFSWLLASAGPLYVASLIGVAITAMRRFHIQVPFRVLHVVLVFAFSAWLIPRYGLVGAGEAMFASAMVFAGMMLILLAICASSSMREPAAAPVGPAQGDA